MEAKETSLPPEIIKNINRIAAHEGAHAFISMHLGIPLMKIEMQIVNNRHSGGVIWNDLTGVTFEQQGIAYVAGLAGELFVMGENDVRENGFKGLKTDSLRLSQLGFKTQDKKAQLLSDALKILTTYKADFLSLHTLLTQLLIKSVQEGNNSLSLGIEDLRNLGIQKHEFHQLLKSKT